MAADGGCGGPRASTAARVGGDRVRGADASEVSGDGPEFYFRDVFVFVTDYLAHTIRRPLDGESATWCPRWWEHPEAGARLASLWLAWEHLRHDPALGMTTWWLQHADPYLRVLMDPQRGPFAGCSPLKGHTQTPFEPLPVDPYDPVQSPWDGMTARCLEVCGCRCGRSRRNVLPATAAAPTEVLRSPPRQARPQAMPPRQWRVPSPTTWAGGWAPACRQCGLRPPRQAWERGLPGGQPTWGRAGWATLERVLASG
ncbi:DUF4913 domain-containing protein [Streptomyces sp. NBC_01210]|uniref:DUF4913 domain-containing protein n=1 Tax=Streptomyces sp. NBC_01210 TaxID=2903774 RepID=UPI002E0F2E3F|nr:DUF4913 domain-containing protein [Streptomyces sp. NBC_01210]